MTITAENPAIDTARAAIAAMANSEMAMLTVALMKMKRDLNRFGGWCKVDQRDEPIGESSDTSSIGPLERPARPIASGTTLVVLTPAASSKAVAKAKSDKRARSTAAKAGSTVRLRRQQLLAARVGAEARPSWNDPLRADAQAEAVVTARIGDGHMLSDRPDWVSCKMHSHPRGCGRFTHARASA